MSSRAGTQVVDERAVAQMDDCRAGTQVGDDRAVTQVGDGRTGTQAGRAGTHLIVTELILRWVMVELLVYSCG